MSAFDTVVMVDWSGGNDRGKRPVKDAIWICVAEQGRSREPLYMRNRQDAETWLGAFLAQEKAAGRRVFAGFDFPFGYPTGFAKALTGKEDPFAVWEWFEAHVEDSPTSNNRFDLAGQMNRDFGANGPFWANGLDRDIDGLPRTKQEYENPFSEKRRAEGLAKGAFTCWQMAGAGAVGSQIFMGLPVVSRLRRALDAAVWPFENVEVDIVLAEIWPSLTLGKAPDDQIKDAWQVQEVARMISSLTSDEMQMILKVTSPQEGWIFGLGHEETLRIAAKRPPQLTNSCFALPPGVDWTPVDQALERLRRQLTPIKQASRLALDEAHGRIAATDAFAQRSNPPLPNTAVDGYGFNGARDDAVHVLPLSDARAAAGDAPVALAPGHAIRVLTGAALPTGVDTVVLQEDVTVSDGQIAFRGPVKRGANTRQAGEDVSAGELVVAKGTRINAAEAAILSATGVGQVDVFAPLRVAVISTGAELIDTGQTAKAGQIFDANRPMLSGMVEKFGHEVVDMGIVADDRSLLADAFDRAADAADVIITSGGASAGDEDHVSALLQDAGAMTLWRIAVKPGRPLALGMWKGVPVFGLPGNPVAAMVCCSIFARPAMAQLAGENWPTPQGFYVPAAFSKNKKDGRSEFLRARITDGQAEVFPSEGSGRISGLSWASGLVELPQESAQIEPGDMVKYIPFSSFGL